MYAGDHERVAADAEQQGQVPLVPLSLLSSADLIHTSIHNCLMQRHCYAALKPESSLTHWHACLQVTASVSSVSLPMLSSKGTSLVPQLIHDYLMHHRCWQTAAILSKDLLCPQVCVCTSHPLSSDFNYQKSITCIQRETYPGLANVTVAEQLDWMLGSSERKGNQ